MPRKVLIYDRFLKVTQLVTLVVSDRVSRFEVYSNRLSTWCTNSVLETGVGPVLCIRCVLLLWWVWVWSGLPVLTSAGEFGGGLWLWTLCV